MVFSCIIVWLDSARKMVISIVAFEARLYCPPLYAIHTQLDYKFIHIYSNHSTGSETGTKGVGLENGQQSGFSHRINSLQGTQYSTQLLQSAPITGSNRS
jgi:hypothetical protein